MKYEYLATLNAILNAGSSVFLLLGYRFIRRKEINKHRACMLSAVTVATLFFVSYITYHLQVGSVPFKHGGWIRPVYFFILITHVILAAAIVPFVIYLLTRAFKGEFEKHKRVARFVFPTWLYVSVTGVIVYFMLYHL